MTTLEITLSIAIVFVSFTALRAVWYFNTSYWDAMYIWKEQRDTIQELTKQGKFDALLNVEDFNRWFNMDKDKDIYAHPGIFLRTDKLSLHHIRDFIRMESKGIADMDNFDYKTIVKFEDEIRNDWFKKLEER